MYSEIVRGLYATADGCAGQSSDGRLRYTHEKKFRWFYWLSSFMPLLGVGGVGGGWWREAEFEDGERIVW